MKCATQRVKNLTLLRVVSEQGCTCHTGGLVWTGSRVQQVQFDDWKSEYTITTEVERRKLNYPLHVTLYVDCVDEKNKEMVVVKWSFPQKCEYKNKI